MLTEIFGPEWYKVHDEAEQLEHAVSADFERKLQERLGTDVACPHGNMVGLDSPGARRRGDVQPAGQRDGLHRLAFRLRFRDACPSRSRRRIKGAAGHIDRKHYTTPCDSHAGSLLSKTGQSCSAAL